MNLFTAIVIVSGLFAALCLLGLPLWILGVPGVEGQYAKGWIMGLYVLLIFPGVWLLNYIPYFLFGRAANETTRASWQQITSAVALIAVVLALGRLFQAFKTMM